MRKVELRLRREAPIDNGEVIDVERILLPTIGQDAATPSGRQCRTQPRPQ